jgi:hypothetical protein
MKQRNNEWNMLRLGNLPATHLSLLQLVWIDRLVKQVALLPGELTY